MKEKTKKKQLAILGILKSTNRTLSGSKIAQELSALGYEISERTARLYLQEMDNEGLTENLGRIGRRITEKGLTELGSARIVERVGFISAKIDRITYGMNFDLTTNSGTVVVNVTLVNPNELATRVDMISKVFEHGYAMGHLLAFLSPGEQIGYTTVPENMVGISTICSFTLNGVLLKYGIPTNSRFGGLLELRDRKPTRFVEIINYDGTSIDPLEVFIRSGMTDYVGAVKSGNGRIGASFREFPAESRDLVEELSHKLERIGLGAFMTIGRNSQPLLDVPVSEGRIGAIVIGGLNPVAILEETGVRVYSRAMAGMIDYNKLFHYEELISRIRAYL